MELSIGSDPQGVAYDSTNGDIYVADLGSGTVKVISGLTDTVVDTIPVGNDPQALAFDAANGEIYVAPAQYNYNGSLNEKAYSASVLTVINGATNTVVGNVSVPAQQISLPSGNVTGYQSLEQDVVYDSGNCDIYAVNFSTVLLPGSGSLGISAVNASTNEVTATVILVPCASDCPQPPGGYVVHMAVDPSNGEIFVTDNTQQVSVINASTDEVIGNLTVAADAQGIYFDPANGDIYVASSPRTVSVFDASNWKEVASICADGCPWNFEPDLPLPMTSDTTNGDIFVANAVNELGQCCGIAIFNGTSNSLPAPPMENYFPYGELSSSIGGTIGGITFDPANGEIYATSSETGTVLIANPSAFLMETSATSASTSIVSTSTVSGGGVPEFPPQVLVILVFVILAVFSYLMVRPFARKSTAS